MSTEFERFVREGMYEHYMDGLHTTTASVTFDIGSYTGDSLVRLRSKVQGVIHGFEPIRSFWSACGPKLQPYSGIYVHPIGVGDTDAIRSLSVHKDETSEFLTSLTTEQCVFRSFFTVWNHLNIETLDVLHMNIEGGEYAVFRSILEHGLLPKIKTIIVQFHYPNQYSEHREAIQSELRKTHQCVYDYPFVWERWDLQHTPS